MNFDRKHISRVRKRLLAWYGQHARDLPWRRTRDPYRIWISEMMLQQTQVKTVKPYYLRFVRALPSVRRLAAVSEGRVMKLWEGLGYYRRARFLHQAARLIVQGRAGKFPATSAEWRELPGVGPYMAGALASIISGERTAAVDGNVKRILARLLGIREAPGNPAAEALIRATAEALVPAHAAGDFNQALMDLGAGVCRPKAPLCGQCPICCSCAARASGRPEIFPGRIRKKRVPKHKLAAAVVRRQGRYLVGQRPPGGLLGGLWEFPTVRIAGQGTPDRALRRMGLETLGMPLQPAVCLGTVEHGYTHFTITVRVMLCTSPTAAFHPVFHPRLRWVTAAQAKRLPFSRVDGKIWDLLARNRPGGDS